MKIAVLGAGFAGLSVTYHLLRYRMGRAAIDLYDPEPIGQGPSGISLGLFNPYAGKRAKRGWKADSCIFDLHRLLTVSSQAISQPLILSKGILRPAFTDERIEYYQTLPQEDPNLEWWPSEKCMKTLQGLTLPEKGGGLYIKEGLTIHVPHYLEGLFRACVNLGAIYKQSFALSKQVLENYDKVIVCLGANSIGFKELKHLPMTPVKGQILTLKWPSHVPPLAMSLVGEKQIVMNPGYDSCSIGSTYEHDFQDLKAHKEYVYQELMPKILPFFPSLADAEVLGCRSGVRASSRSRFPLLGRIADHFWFFTGLGSKGLLQHAWLGKRLARAILENDPAKHLPSEVCQIDAPPQQS